MRLSLKFNKKDNVYSCKCSISLYKVRFSKVFITRTCDYFFDVIKFVLVVLGDFSRNIIHTRMSYRHILFSNMKMFNSSLIALLTV